MAFRTIEITKPTELHMKNGQLEISQEEGVVMVPVEDISQIFCVGPDIRVSTIPFEGHARQSQLMHLQVEMEKEFRELLWGQIIEKKISNQSRALSLLGLEGAEKVMEYALTITSDNVDTNEALAAKDYF